jgi:eukaryotic-like serine/threonine-protein kinase
LDAQQTRQVEQLLLTMSLQSPAERVELLDDLARTNPVLAAQLSLQINAGGALTGTQAITSPIGLPARFEVTGRLGQGSFGTVYDAFDREQGRTVAVKILRHAHPDSLFRFKQEFRVLTNLRHPNLVELYELFESGQLWFFTMELVRGTSFLNYVRENGSCDLSRLKHTVASLAGVLSWLHENEILHRDIKPDNAVVDHTGRLALLDFGLARHLAPDTHSGTMTVGTPAYMAPEQMAEGAVTYAADWYAVGALMYHALTGAVPFQGTIMQVLTAKATHEPLPPSALASGVPADWDNMTSRLLQRDPEARPAGKELLAWLGAVNRPASSPRPSKGHVCIGRDGALQRMLATADAMRTGQPAVIEITGPSGFGKSTLIQAFATSFLNGNPTALVIRGRCYEHESVPFKAVDQMVDDLARQLQRMGDAAGPALPDDVAALARLFPVLERVPAIAEAVRSRPLRIANISEARRRAFLAFASLIERLADSHALVICLDDVHWGDADSAALFQHLYARPVIPVFDLILSYRPGPAGAGFVRLIKAQTEAAAHRVLAQTEQIGPLDAGAATELARLLLLRQSIASDDPAMIAARCEGNPLLLEQIVGQLARFGHSQTAAAPASVAEFVRDRVGRLSGVARRFLEILAAAGEPLPESVAVNLISSAPGDSTTGPAAILSSLVSQYFVRCRDSGGVREVEIYHDQIRAAIVEQVPELERRAIHLRIADALVSVNYEDEGMIALQFARGGDAARAARYSVLAAEAAETVLAFDRAAQFYGMALALNTYEAAECSSLFERLARAHAAGGRGGDAARAYERAAEAATAQERQIDLRRHAAEELIRCGNVRQGVALLVRIGSRWNIRYHGSTVSVLASIFWSRAALAIRGLRYQERQERQITAGDLAKLDLYWAFTAGLSLWNPMIGASFQLRHLRLALRAGEPRRLGLAFATEGAYRALAGERAYAEARSLLGRALAMGGRLNDPRIIGTAQAMGGMSGWLSGRWDVARDLGLEGEQTLRENCAGVSWELSVARNAALGGLLWSGDWKRYAERLREWTLDAQDRGDMNSLSVYRMNQSPVSLAAGDPQQASEDLDEAEKILSSAWSAEGLHVPHLFGLLGRVGVAIYQGRAAAGFNGFEQRLKSFRRSPILRIETLAIFALYLEGTLATAAASELPRGSAKRDALLQSAKRSCRALREKHAVWSLGLALSVEGAIEGASGRNESAHALWGDAERELQRSGMRMFAAAAHYHRVLAAGDKNALKAAEKPFLDEGVREPARMVTVLIPGIQS